MPLLITTKAGIIRRLRSLTLAGLVIGAALVVSAERSDANFVTANSRSWTSCTTLIPCMTNDKSVYTFTGDLGPQMLTATNGALSSINATNLNTFAGAYAHGSGTDIYYGYEDLPGPVGRYMCVTIEGGWKCTHAHVMYDGDALAGYSAFSQRFAACHESGHAVGLTHGEDGSPQLANNATALECMKTPIQTSGSNILGTHNNAHINSNYP